MSLEAFNSSESIRPTNEAKVEEAETLLQSIRDLYNRNPFTKKAFLVMGLLASFSAKSAEAVDSNESAALLSSTEFIEQVSELTQHPEIILAAQELREFQNSETEKAESANWYGYSNYQELHGAEGMVNWEERYPDFPQSGSGVFAMSSLLQDAMSAHEKEGELDVALYTGISQHYTIKSEEGKEIVPTGEAYTVSITLEEGLDKDGQIIDAIASKLGEMEGITMSTEGKTSNEGGVGNEAEINSKDSIGSRVDVPLASWSVSEVLDGEEVTGYTVTIQPGTIVELEGVQN